MAGRILHESGVVERADGVLVGYAGGDDLAASGPAGHEMRLDQPGGDPQIGLDETAGRASPGCPGSR